MEVTGSTRVDATPSVLVVHTAVSYQRVQRLGIGLIQRIACARTGKTKDWILPSRKQGLKIRVEEFAAPQRHSHRRAEAIALLKALDLARSTVKKNTWLKTVAPTVRVFLGRACKDILEVITHHIEHEPESYKSLQEPHRSTVEKIINRIHQIRRAGFKVSVTMFGHHGSAIERAAAKEAKRRFKRARRDSRKISTQKAHLASDVDVTRDKDDSFELPIRGICTMEKA